MRSLKLLASLSTDTPKRTLDTEHRSPGAYIAYRGSTGEKIEEHVKLWERGVAAILQEREEANSIATAVGGLDFGSFDFDLNLDSNVSETLEESSNEHQDPEPVNASAPAESVSSTGNETELPSPSRPSKEELEEIQREQAQRVRQAEEQIEADILARRRLGKDRLRARMRERALLQAKRASVASVTAGGVLIRRASSRKSTVMKRLSFAGKKTEAQPAEPSQKQAETTSPVEELVTVADAVDTATTSVEAEAKIDDDAEADIPAPAKLPAFRPISLGMGFDTSAFRLSLGLAPPSAP